MKANVVNRLPNMKVDSNEVKKIFEAEDYAKEHHISFLKAWTKLHPDEYSS